MESKQKSWELSDVVWLNVFLLGYLHVIAIYAVWLLLTGHCTWTLWWFNFPLIFLPTMGVTGGYHRLWTHKTYKANLPLRIILAIMGTMTYQNNIYVWARDHRVHHKFTETDADPHNANRGFFFAHVGWLLVKKHKDVTEKGKIVDMSDLEQDGVVMFQKKYYMPLVMLGTFIIPTLVPYYVWNQDLWYCYYASVLRYIFTVNLVWCINSVTHLYGPKPYDKTMGPTQNPVMVHFGLGEGFHNYHHVFPWDYKAAEFGGDIRNLTTYMIEMFAWLGWATELKTASKNVIEKQAARCGDGSRLVETSTNSIYILKS